MKSASSDLDSSWNTLVSYKLAGMYIRVSGETTVCRGIQVVATNIFYQSCSLIWVCTVIEMLGKILVWR